MSYGGRGTESRATVQNQLIGDIFPADVAVAEVGGGSDDGFAAVRRLGLLQFALTEALDGAQQGGAASSSSGLRRRRSGNGGGRRGGG